MFDNLCIGSLTIWMGVSTPAARRILSMQRVKSTNVEISRRGPSQVGVAKDASKDCCLDSTELLID